MVSATPPLLQSPTHAAVRTQAQTCWDRAVESAGGLEARQRVMQDFNERSRFRKRGMAMTPTKFGISFTTKFLNQVRPPLQLPSGSPSLKLAGRQCTVSSRARGSHTVFCTARAMAHTYKDGAVLFTHWEAGGKGPAQTIMLCCQFTWGLSKCRCQYPHP